MRLLVLALLLSGIGVESAYSACLFSAPSDFCVRGSLYNTSGTTINYGPIDLCYGWDFNCTAPLQTVFELNGGQYYFQMSTASSWYVKPRPSGINYFRSPADNADRRYYASGQVAGTFYQRVEENYVRFP